MIYVSKYKPVVSKSYSVESTRADVDSKQHAKLEVPLPDPKTVRGVINPPRSAGFGQMEDGKKE